MILRLRFLETCLDESVIHVEQSDADLVEHHIQTIAKSQRLLSSLTELRKSQVLQFTIKRENSFIL